MKKVELLSRNWLIEAELASAFVWKRWRKQKLPLVTFGAALSKFSACSSCLRC